MKGREQPRYRLSALVRFSWQSSPGGLSQGEGVTRDIGGGAFVITGKCPPQNAKVHIAMFLPELYIPAPIMQIFAEGIVVRVEHRAGERRQSGFAVVSDDLSLERIARRLNHQPGLW